MKKVFLILFCIVSLNASAIDDPKMLIRKLNEKFSLVADYTALVHMKFDIPGVKMNTMNGKVFFKSPNKFRIRTKGIFFLPKQNPMQNMSAMLLDTNSYTSIISGYEIVDGKNCAIVNIIPLKAVNDLILGKFWIDVTNPQVLKTQITTKNSGTIETENYYSTNSKYNLPDRIIIKVEIKKIKLNKMISGDLNKKAQDKTKDGQLETGIIALTFTNFKVNSKVLDSEFTEY